MEMEEVQLQPLQQLPSISVCVPAFSEGQGIVRTIDKLLEQFAFQRNDAEIVVADYDPDGNGETRKAVEDNYEAPGVRVIPVHARGIAHARNMAIMVARGKYIVCFDADTEFERPDALDLLTIPLATGSAVFTCADNVFPAGELDPNSPAAIYLNGCCIFQRSAPVCCLEPGFSFTKSAYMAVGGFDDVNWAEGLRLSSKFLFNYGAQCKKHIEDVKVITSARRAKKLGELGFGVFDYTNAIRNDKVLKT